MVTISIVIPSFNRCESLKQTLDSCSKLHPWPNEIIVIDDASTDGTKSLVQNYDHIFIQYIRLRENRGQAYARSLGLSKAQGEIIVSLDDDSYFMDIDALLRLGRRFQDQKKCGILAFRIFTPRDQLKPPDERLFYVSDHITCGCAYRKSMLDEIGYHLTFMQGYGEEADISLKAFNAGYKIILDYSIRVFHDFDPANRDKTWHETVRRQGVRNDLLEVLIRFPFAVIFPVLVAKTISHFRFGWQRRLVMSTLQGLFGFLNMAPRAIRNRNPVRLKTIRRYLALRGKAEPVISLWG